MIIAAIVVLGLLVVAFLLALAKAACDEVLAVDEDE